MDQYSESNLETRPVFSSAEEGSSVSVSTILRGFRMRWRLFTIIILLSWIVGGAYILLAPKQYEADVEFYYVEQNNAAQSSATSGFAALGLGMTHTSGREVALATLQSRQLATIFVKRYNLLPALFSNDWNSTTKNWNVETSKIPTPADGAAKLHKILTVTDDTETGVVTLAVEFNDRNLVAPLANNFVKMVDDIVRKSTLDESQQRLDYLEQQLAKTSVNELRSSITDLIEKELKLTTFTKTQENFAFKIIDPAIQPKYPVWPRPSILLAVLTFLALIGAGFTSVFIDLHKAGYFS